MEHYTVNRCVKVAYTAIPKAHNAIQRRCGMKRADVERFKFTQKLNGMFYDRLLAFRF
jgi:hypothetical protein